MAAISASYSFTPAVTGGQISVTGNTETEIKSAVKAVLATRSATTQAQLDALAAAASEMDA